MQLLGRETQAAAHPPAGELGLQQEPEQQPAPLGEAESTQRPGGRLQMHSP